MPTSIYFSGKAQNEQTLYEDLVIESLQFYGQDVYYLPRSIVSRDMVLNEDVESQFDDAYIVEMYIENTEGFEGEGNLLSKFGLEIRDEATFIVAKKRWDSLVGQLDGQSRPNEGDLIYLPMSNSFFEISFVEHEQPFYQLQNLPIYKLQARLFEFNDEDFNTGVESIDGINKSAFTTNLILSNVVGTFIDGETITQVVSTVPDVRITGRITGYDVDNNRLSVVDLETNDGEFHQFVTAPIISDLTSTTADVVTVEDVDSINSFSSDPFAQNYVFENNADFIIDFSESNPFGDTRED